MPLRILEPRARARRKVVDADVFLLTDDRRSCSPADAGLEPRAQRAGVASLLTDLRSDKGMEWVPEHMWFTYLQLDVPAGQLDYDLAISTSPNAVPPLADTGRDRSAGAPGRRRRTPGSRCGRSRSRPSSGSLTFGLAWLVRSPARARASVPA